MMKNISKTIGSALAEFEKTSTGTMFAFNRRAWSAILALAAFGYTGQGLANAQVARVGDNTVLTVQGNETVDFVNAKPMPLPSNPVSIDTTQMMVQALLSPPAFAAPGYSPGGEGNGIQSPVFVGAPVQAEDGIIAEDGVRRDDSGSSNHPFTTARADLQDLNTNTAYPYRAAGKLYLNINNTTYYCSASLIKPGIVVTAAACVANYGKKQFYSDFQFIPGYRNGVAPFGTWTVAHVWVKSAYLDGTDNCAVAASVCPDDVALLTLNTQKGAYVGTAVGWYGFGYNGFGFTTNGLTQITQLGYAAGLDNGSLMERNDSYGYVSASYSDNTVIGSNMNAGAIGGPWIVKFGIAPTLTGETNGGAAYPNMVVGVMAWYYTSTAPKEVGASPFTSNNILSLLNSACSSTPSACK
ncbi:MAG: trypsin-like serine protease [Acidobacteriaceae bacterium]|nr:trypsin-like serine protease [Acidobacteriaceae bacterium]MBV9779459.1 trypsin-like serine protease [Acidobacteriaceae bacterium]